jgi:hypothetical protein
MRRAYPLAITMDSASSGKARQSFDIDNLAGLRSGNHVLEIGVLVDRPARIVALFVLALNAALLLVLLLLLAGLLAAAFFQLVSLGLAYALADSGGRVRRAGSGKLLVRLIPRDAKAAPRRQK